MNFLYFLKLYLSTAVVYFGVDMLWLGLTSKNFYAKYLGHLLAKEVNLLPAVIFYLLYVVGIIIFCVSPALLVNRIGQAVFLGGLFGFFCYTTYDLTNFATLKKWPLIVVLVDLAWGVFVSGLIAGISFLIGQKFLL